MQKYVGFILLFEGDKRRVKLPVKGTDSFDTVTEAFMQGGTDVTATYNSDAPAVLGNMLMSSLIGGNASIPHGNYRLYLSGKLSNQNIYSYYWDVLVLPKDGSFLENIPDEDYGPLIAELVLFEGDNWSKTVILPGADISAVTAVFKLDSEDKTSAYCSNAATYTNDEITTHTIGGLATVPAGTYCYFITATYNNSEAVTTFFFKINAIPKQGIL